MTRPLLLAVGISLVFCQVAPAQLAPNADWRTIATPHFRVHFTPELEVIARRAAANAEIAYAQLSAKLTPPRGPIDLVLSDDVDFTNGYATPLPTNRIVVYVNPPVVETALRFTDDPDATIITHELTHIFHLDRSRGIWRLGQGIFGRAPFLFPNVYSPAWITEGLAVYYETRLTGTGRVNGSEHRMLSRAEALERRFPGIDEMSLATPRFPWGESPYAFGSLFMDYLARTRGDARIREFVEASSVNLIPIWLDYPAKRAFGSSFESAWREWGDSIVKSVGDLSPPTPGWRYLTDAGGLASFVRWEQDTAVTFAGGSGRESGAAFRATLGGDVRRIDRRNSDSPTLLLPNGGRLFSQLEYVDGYHIRSDLFVQRGRHTSRLSEKARLLGPDVRSDGRIVAVQTVPAGTRLVLVPENGEPLALLTSGGVDEQWAEPRWSPNGHYIAAAHWMRGGTSEIAIIDTSGTIVQRIAPAHAVQASPSWSADGTRILFSSDRNGVGNLYSAAFAPSGDEDLKQLTNVPTGIFYPEISPDGRWLAASTVLGDGYHVGVAPMARLTARPPEPLGAEWQPHSEAPPSTFDGEISRYNPWRSLWPRYWMPVLEPSIAGGSRLGAFTSGTDVVGRHSYDAQVFVPTDATGITGYVDYAYAGFGIPIVTASASQDWGNSGPIVDSNNVRVGLLRERTRSGSLGLTFFRPRYRTYSSLSLVVGVDSYSFATDPPQLLSRIDPSFSRTYNDPWVLASVAWTNAQRPLLSMSPEDGVSASLSGRERFTDGDASRATLTAVGVGSAYKSLDLPGFAHHVIAIRGAAGFSDNQATDYLQVGGVSGSVLTVVPGVVIGSPSRAFPVRGFEAGSLIGLRAFAGSAEYRLPLVSLNGGVGTMPFFLDRSAVNFFYDVGSAWCPMVLAGGPLCTSPAQTTRTTIASFGAELNVTAAVLQWDTPYRFRAGVAFPAISRELFSGRDAAAYFTIGLAF